ncbi:MAG: cytosine deaminase [Cyanobacteria bacterium M_surface_10_m2_179]|nr:cytosine deaminase [Cyanobacteria bacterium M_surface_10_m2_179]
MPGLQVQLPRLLLDPQQRDLPCGDADGLVSVQIDHAAGRVVAIRPVHPAASLPLAFTPLVDAHVHLDKAFSWAEVPNRAGTMAQALSLNLAEGEQRSREAVMARAERALEQAWRYGLRALRSHVDSGGPAAEPSWEALLELQQRWRGRVELQLVALAPLAHWGTQVGRDLAQRVASCGGLLGGVLGPPFPRSRHDRRALQTLLQLADALGCGLDLHVDEAGEAPGAGVGLLLEVLEQQRPPQLPISCSHASSLGLLPAGAQRRLAERLAAQAVSVIALPTTNFWLLGREGEHDLPQRPLAPLRLLQRCGVAVAVGADNVQDPWYPGGDFDPLELLRLAFRAFHAAPWQRQGLMPFSTTPAQLLGLEWDGILRRGAPADLLITSATSWSSLLAGPPQRRVLRSGCWLEPPARDQPAPALASLGAIPSSHPG